MRVDTAPSSSTESWDGLSTAMPSSDRSHANRPHSSRLANRQRPPSHHNSLSRSPRRPRKQTVTRERILPELRLHLRRQAVEPFAHVGGTRRQPHPAARRQRFDRSSSITCRSVWALTSPRRCTRAPQSNAISMTLAIRPPQLTVIRREPSRHFRTLLLATAAAAI
jgi:hypothetical protein